MESVLEDDQGPEQEAVSSQSSVTSTCRGTKETDGEVLSNETVMEVDSDLLGNLQPPTLEMLTNEIIKPGTQASISPCHKESSQGSHDVSPSNDNTQGMCNATLLGELESSHAVVKMATEETHVDCETRFLKEENKVHCKDIETSSDDTDDWETASEESVELDLQPHDPHRVREDTGSDGQEKPNEDAGTHSPKTISEDTMSYGQETVSEAGLHNYEQVIEDAQTLCKKAVNEEVGPHGHKMTDEDAGPHDNGTVSEDASPHGLGTVSEDARPHGQERASEDTGPESDETKSKDIGLHSPGTVSEDNGIHSLGTVNEDAWPHGHKNVNEEAGSHGHETVRKDTGFHGQERMSEGSEPHGQEIYTEDSGLHSHEIVKEDVEIHGNETISREVEAHGHDTVGEDFEPHDYETVSMEAGPHGHETDRDEAGPHDHETDHDEHAPYGHDTVGEQVQLQSHETFGEEPGYETVGMEPGPPDHEIVGKEPGTQSHDLVCEELKPPGQETVGEEPGLPDHDIVGEEPELPDHDIVGEEPELPDHDIVGDELRSPGYESIGEEPRPSDHEIVGEEPRPPGHETDCEEPRTHGHETVNVDELCGLEPVSEETSNIVVEPLSQGDMKTDDRAVTLYIQDKAHDDTTSYNQWTVNEEVGPHGQEMGFMEETVYYGEEKSGPLVHDTVGDLTMYHREETVSNLVTPSRNETVSDMTRPYSSYTDIEIQDNETVSAIKSNQYDEDYHISLYKDRTSAVPDQTLKDVATVNENTTDDKKETLSMERQDENKPSAEMLAFTGEKIKSDSTYDKDVSEVTFSDGTHGGLFEVVGPEMQGIYKDHIEENSLQKTSGSEYTEVGNTNASMTEVSERMEEVQGGKPIITELSSEEKEIAEISEKSKYTENCELHEEFSKDSRVFDESSTKEDELDGHDSKQRRDLAKAAYKHVITQDTEITYLDCERLEDELHGIKTFVETGEELSENLISIIQNQETVLDLQYNTPVTTDEKSYIGSTMGIDAQLDDSDLEERMHADYAKTITDTETKSLEPEYITTTQKEPCNNLGLSYSAEPEAQVISFHGQEDGTPYMQLSGSHTDQSIHLRHDLQSQRLGGSEHQEEKTTEEMLDPHSNPGFSQVDPNIQDIPRDEPDHYKLDFFPVTMKGIRIVCENPAELGSESKAHDLLPKITDTEYMPRQKSIQLPLQESVIESVHQESTLDNISPVIGTDQETMSPGSENANTTTTNTENIKLVRRQRSNTDPYRLHDKEEKLQDISNTQGSSRGRLRSLTPPLDKFTSPYTPSSPKPLEQSTNSVFFSFPDENKSSPEDKQKTSSKEYNFHPTQIFNPMLFLGHSIEESGFYQEETLRQENMENASQWHLQSSPEDNPVPLHTQNPERIVEEPKTSLKSTVEATSTKPMSAPLVAPVWLPPQPTRYVGSSDRLNEIRSMKPSENPLMRRATIRHKRSNVGVTNKRFSNPVLPPLPQRDYPTAPRTSNLPKVQSVEVNKIQISSKNRQLSKQQKISAETSSCSMETVREEGHHTLKERTSNSPECVLLRGSRSKTKPPSSDSSQSIHRRYSTFINSSNLLYQEYSDVALNQEIQRQKPGGSPAEESQPSSPRVRRRNLSSQESYLQRLSISSADSLWQDIPKIRDSAAFLTMTREEQKLQEAKFELIMSEALYLRSLNIAVDHFQRSNELQEVLSAQDRQWLFSRLSEVRDASSDFLFDLEEEFESNMYNFQVCDVVINHVPNFRRVYLPYVTNQTYQDRTFQALKNGNPRFQQVLAKMESDPVCQRLSLKSFLILPFQRITRLRLLLQNILKRSAPGSTEELQATEAHNALEKLIRDCNESVQRMKDTEELILLNQKIQFECKIFPLISQSRRLVKHGEVTSLEYNSMSFKWKLTTRPVYLHLFNDCLLLSRVREGGRFVVFDHASEFRVERCEIKIHTNQKNIFRVFLRDAAAAAMGRECSQDVKETEYMFRTETQSQKLRWICALSSPKEETDFFRDHGLSQMQCLKSYKARENDELSLEKADILMITQNSDDGWLHGIRLSDQQSGWFPLTNVQPISRNACIRNLQEEQRLQTARAKLQPSGTKGH